jgi:hypothetical protein
VFFLPPNFHKPKVRSTVVSLSMGFGSALALLGVAPRAGGLSLMKKARAVRSRDWFDFDTARRQGGSPMPFSIA